MIFQNVWRRVVGNELMVNSASHMFPNMLFTERFQQNCQTAGLFLAASSITGLKLLI